MRLLRTAPTRQRTADQHHDGRKRRTIMPAYDGLQQQVIIKLFRSPRPPQSPRVQRDARVDVGSLHGRRNAEEVLTGAFAALCTSRDWASLACLFSSTGLVLVYYIKGRSGERIARLLRRAEIECHAALVSCRLRISCVCILLFSFSFPSYLTFPQPTQPGRSPVPHRTQAAHLFPLDPAKIGRAHV